MYYIFSQEKRRVEGKGKLFNRGHGDRTRGNVFNLKECISDIRKKFLTVRVVRHWSRLPER